MSLLTETEILTFLDKLADLSAAAILPHFRAALTIEDKGQGQFDPVTVADRAAERVIVEAIQQQFPTHAILGEEYGARVGTASYRWIIDPIDGTRAFISGVPTWGTLIGLWHGETPLYGMMTQPFIGERFIGSPHGAWWRRGNARVPLHTRQSSSLATASLFATAPEMFEPTFEWPRFQALAARARLTRYGVDCYAYCLLAAGHIDLVVEAGLGLYDVAALIPIIEAAGGIITDWTGQPLRDGGRVIAAATIALHAEALAVLGGT